MRVFFCSLIITNNRQKFNKCYPCSIYLPTKHNRIIHASNRIQVEALVLPNTQSLKSKTNLIKWIEGLLTFVIWLLLHQIILMEHSGKLFIYRKYNFVLLVIGIKLVSTVFIYLMYTIWNTWFSISEYSFRGINTMTIRTNPVNSSPVTSRKNLNNPPPVRNIIHENLIKSHILVIIYNFQIILIDFAIAINNHAY